MKKIAYRTLLATAVLGLWTLNFTPESPYLPVLVNDAQARFGRHVSPVSVAGVARRTTRRAVVTSSASATTAPQQQQQAQPQQAASALPAGTVVSALPSGCTSMVVEGVSMFNCGSVMYQPTFQSNNLVYVVK